MDVAIFTDNLYNTPFTPPVIFWLTLVFKAVAVPEMIAEGDVSTPDQTVAVVDCVEIVSPAANLDAKSKV